MMDPLPPDPGTPGERRPFTGMESFFMFLCLVVPGVAAAAFAYAGFAWTYSYSSSGNETLKMVVVLTLFLAVALGCCAFGGWLIASKSGEERRTPRAIKSALILLLAQFFLVPAIGWGTCAAFVAGFS